MGKSTGSIHMFTSAAVNYLPKVRMLCASVKQHHPEFVVHLALADEMPQWLDSRNEPFDTIITLRDLDIPNLRSWVFCHSLVALSTGIKPFVVRHLLEKRECRAVLYFDPDIVLFSRLDDLLEEFEANSILLTPHLTKPELTLEAIMDNEICSLRHGIFNLGFVGVRNDEQGKAFTDWWAERCRHFCVDDMGSGLFVDQRWVDLAPVFFEGVKILKSPRFNVATWNITTRELKETPRGCFMVDGQPLGFYHFTGFDSGAHEVMATKYARDNASVRTLVEWYKRNIASDERAFKTPWAFAGFENGEPITQPHRAIYRLRRDLQESYPDPFQAPKGRRCYYSWFRERASIEHPELAGCTPARGSRLWQYGRRALCNYRYGIHLFRRALSVLRHEGLKGLQRRLH